MKRDSLVLLLLMLAGVVLGGFLGHLAKDISWLAWLDMVKALELPVRTVLR